MREERESTGRGRGRATFGLLECLPGVCLVFGRKGKVLGVFLSFGWVLQFSGLPTAGGIVRDPGGIGRDCAGPPAATPIQTFGLVEGPSLLLCLSNGLGCRVSSPACTEGCCASAPE